MTSTRIRRVELYYVLSALAQLSPQTRHWCRTVPMSNSNLFISCALQRPMATFTRMQVSRCALKHTELRCVDSPKLYTVRKQRRFYPHTLASGFRSVCLASIHTSCIDIGIHRRFFR